MKHRIQRIRSCYDRIRLSYASGDLESISSIGSPIPGQEEMCGMDGLDSYVLGRKMVLALCFRVVMLESAMFCSI